MKAMTREQAGRRGGDRVLRSAVTDQTDQAGLDDPYALGKALSTAQLLLDGRELGADDGVRIVAGIGQLRHGNAEQPVESRRLEMDGELIDPSEDGQAGKRPRLWSDDGHARRGVRFTGPGTQRTVAVLEEERQELLGPRRQVD